MRKKFKTGWLLWVPYRSQGNQRDKCSRPCSEGYACINSCILMTTPWGAAFITALEEKLRHSDSCPAKRQRLNQAVWFLSYLWNLQCKPLSKVLLSIPLQLSCLGGSWSFLVMLIISTLSFPFPPYAAGNGSKKHSVQMPLRAGIQLGFSSGRHSHHPDAEGRFLPSAAAKRASASPEASNRQTPQWQHGGQRWGHQRIHLHPGLWAPATSPLNTPPANFLRIIPLCLKYVGQFFFLEYWLILTPSLNVLHFPIFWNEYNELVYPRLDKSKCGNSEIPGTYFRNRHICRPCLPTSFCNDGRKKLFFHLWAIITLEGKKGCPLQTGLWRNLGKGESSWSLMGGDIRAEGKGLLPKGALGKPSDGCHH